MVNSSQNRQCFCPCDQEIWGMTHKNNRTPLPCHFKLCAMLHSHLWIHTGVTVQKCSIQVKIALLLRHCKLHASFRSHLWVQSRITVQKLSIGVKIVDSSTHGTLKFEGLPQKTIGHLSYAILSFVDVNSNRSYSPEMTKLGQNLFWFYYLALWPLTLIFAWTKIRSMVSTPENFVMIRWNQHCEMV